MELIVVGMAIVVLVALMSPQKSQQTIRVRPWGKWLRPGDRVIILGLPFTGKTVQAAKLTQDADRVLYFDPMHDYASFGAKELSVSELLDNPKVLQSAKWKIALIPDEDNIDEELEDTIKLVRSAQNAIIVFDEVGDYRQSNEHLLNKVARNGRHDGIVPIYVSQVATDIPLTVRRLATRVYSFQQFYPKDIKALTETYGEAYAAQVQQLKGHELAIWTLPTLPPQKLRTSRNIESESEDSSKEKIPR